MRKTGLILIVTIAVSLLYVVTIFAQPNLEVSGIMKGKDKRAMVNGEIVKEGDAISGAEVIEIGDDSVKFKYEGEFFTKKAEVESRRNTREGKGRENNIKAINDFKERVKKIDIDEKTKNKFKGIYSITKKIKGTIKIGIDHADLYKLIQEMSSEIEQVRDIADTNNEKEILYLYESSLKCYYDSLTLWQAIIEHNLNDKSKILPIKNKMIMDSLEPILDKYKIEKVPVVIHVKGEFYVIPKASLTYIWEEAGKYADAANSIVI